MARISVFEAQNAYRRSIMVDSTPVDHPNAAWDSGYRGPKFASSPVVPEDPTAPNFAHPDQIFPKFGALRAPNFVSGFWASGNPGFSRVGGLVGLSLVGTKDLKYRCALTRTPLTLTSHFAGTDTLEPSAEPGMSRTDPLRRARMSTSRHWQA